MNLFGKPVLILGHGVRASGTSEETLTRIMNLGIPVLTSWQAADLVDNTHPNYFGRPGIYGQRTANKILYEADHIIAVGVRMCPWMIGHGGLRPEQRLTAVNVESISGAHEQWTRDASDFLEKWEPSVSCYSWMKQCERWKMDWIEYPLHEDTNGFINSYQFIRRLEPLLPADAILVSDNGSVMCPVFQTLRLKPPQRLLTAGNLGEMGCALPGAIGAAFASKSPVFVFVGDGGMMMNIQELATIKHHNLPIKIFVFENDGYSMIKGTYDNLKKPRKGVSKETGLSFPDFKNVSEAFGITACNVRTWEQFDSDIHPFLAHDGPALMQVHIDPEQLFLPRLKPIIKDGQITPARFDQLSPILE